MEVSNSFRTVAVSSPYYVIRLLKFFIFVLEDFRGDVSLWEVAV